MWMMVHFYVLSIYEIIKSAGPKDCTRDLGELRNHL